MSDGRMSEPGMGGVDYIGPFEYHAVILNGRRVPHLTATPLLGGRVTLELDDRFAVEVTLSDAERLVPFVAHCIAVGMGYTGFPDPETEPTPAVHMPPMSQIDPMT